MVVLVLKELLGMWSVLCVEEVEWAHIVFVGHGC